MSAPLVVQTVSPAQTQRWGRRLGRLLKPGDVVLLTGELGSGKTCFAQGMGRGMGIPQPVKSSSFILLGEYEGPVRLYHADLYRLTEPEEAAELHLEEYARPGVLAVEWPERAADLLPTEHLLVRFEFTSPRGRRLTFEARCNRSEELLTALRRAAREG